MIKPINIMWLIILFCSAYGVFQVKYRVADLRKDLAEINRQLEQERDAIHVLKAEWSYLNQPDRLRNLAQRHLKLEALTVAQINKSLDSGAIYAANGTRIAQPDDELNTLMAEADLLQTSKTTTPQVKSKQKDEAVKLVNAEKKPAQVVLKAPAKPKMLAAAKPAPEPQANEDQVLRMPRHQPRAYPTMQPILTSGR